MASSTLDPDTSLGPDRRLGKGHGMDALGPSDLSDTGSDVQGGISAVDENELNLDPGTNEDRDTRVLPVSHDTSDSGGTGEDSTAGRGGDVELSGDIGFDRIDRINPDEDEDFGDANSVEPTRH